MGETNQIRCMGCMSELDQDVLVCPVCGHRKNTPQNPGCLPPGSRIGGYIIGTVLSQNGESAVYLAWDTLRQEKRRIKEFLPLRICRRNQQTKELEVLPGCETRYKYFRASFEDINKTMQQMTGVDCLIPILELIEEHNTVYVVYQYIEAQTLSEYLKQNGGEELWCRAKRYLLPLLNGVSNLHKKGVTHQGISPQTILLGEEQRPYLAGFCISEVRTDQGELETELFPGYSAPEQYRLDSWQGTWTDVYSLAAVTYRVLTGKEPPPSAERLKGEKVVPAMELDFTITESISDAIEKGLALEADQRYQNVDEFTEKLLETVGSNTAVFQLEDGQRIQDSNPNTVRLNQQEVETAKARVTNRYTVVTMLVTFLILVVFGVALYQQVSPIVSTPLQEDEGQMPETLLSQFGSTAVQEYDVPNFLGHKISEVKANPQYLDKFYFEVKEEYSEEYPAGIIISQTPERGKKMTKKSTVSLTVSKGSEMLTFPSLYNLTQEEAVSAVTRLGFQFKIVEGENSSVEAGRVFRTDPSANEKVKKDSGETVILYVAKEEVIVEPEPEEPEEPENKIIINPRNRPDYSEE